MRFLNPVVMSIVAALVLNGCGERVGSTSSDADEAAIRAQNEKWLEAATAKDAKTIGQLYADDAAMFVPGVPKIVGREAIERGWTDFFSTGMSTSFETEKLIVSKSGDLAVEIGVSKNFKGDVASAETMERGKFVNTWIKRDGKWLVQTESFSSDAPATPAPVPQTAPAAIP